VAFKKAQTFWITDHRSRMTLSSSNARTEERLVMGARQKLNAAYFHICLIIAAARGLAFQSWLAFLAALASTLVSAAPGGAARHGRAADPRGPRRADRGPT
jgi:hypothetical protein